jgi:hypothetical protein
MSPIRPRLRTELTAAVLAGLLGICSAAEQRLAPHADAAPVNQLQISGNACGPAAIIASFRCGDNNWQQALTLLPADDDKQRMGLWIRHYGLQPSVSLHGRKRWTGAGINVDDLVAATNEMTRGLYLPQVIHEDLFLAKKESPEKLLERARDHLDHSLTKGIPPVLSLRRYALRDGSWTFLQGHFVTIVGVARKTEAMSFAITYLDPWGGKKCEGTIRVPSIPLLSKPGSSASCLEAVLPSSNIAKSEVRKGETTAIVPSALIGRW